MIQKQEFIETEIGKIPEDWNFDKLGNHLIIKGRIGWKGLKKSEYGKEGYAIINGEQIVNDSVDWNSCGRITKERYEESPEIMLKENDILMTKDGTIGKLAYITELREPTTVASGVFVIRNNSLNLDQKYLYYVFKSNYFKNLVESRIEGSVVPHLYQRDIVELKIPLPPIQEQRQIAEIFLCLDLKIAINRSMNSTLEAIGQALFKHWFVDFEFPDGEGKPYRSSGGELVETELGEVPKGWRVGRLGDLADNHRRGIQPGAIKPDTPYIGLEHMPRKNIALADWDYAQNIDSNKYIFNKGDILFGKLRPYFHKVGIAAVDGVCSTDILVIAPKEPKWYGYILFHISSDELVNHSDVTSRGTRMPRTNWNDLAQYQIALPPEVVVKIFNDKIKPIIYRIQSNIIQSRTFAAIRDTLLPKLMSGLIRVHVEANL